MTKIQAGVDLCCGIGGFTQAMIQAGIKSEYAVDVDPYCLQTYRENFATPSDCHDLRQPLPDETNWPAWQLLTAGFPCQAFSRAGRRGGFADSGSGGDLFFALREIIARSRPPFVLLENVAHLQYHDHGRSLGLILESLATLGYASQHTVLNARDISGMPQNRERLYIVACLDHAIASAFQFPAATDNFIPWSAILDDPAEPETFLPENSPVTAKIRAHGLREGQIYVWRRYYLRPASQAVCPTLMANMGKGGYNVPLLLDHGRVRQLSPRECLRLQGFPESFHFPAKISRTRQYAQIGNSVSVPTVRRILDALIAAAN